MTKKRYFVTGIGTGVGKTLISALLCEYLKADYFKTVQTGYPPDRDAFQVKNLVTNDINVHSEIYLLKEPASPHLAAEREGIKIDLKNIQLPKTDNHLIIEGAGGLLVPLNEEHYIADLIRHLHAECILVVSNYLGCINHSLLSFYYIQHQQIPFKGIILNGNFDKEVKSAIIKNLKENQVISEIPQIKEINKKTFQEVYSKFIDQLKVEL
ncbi:MAG TPA: dethiobiotin synthase [Bacteroidia bacterium]|nr:dethiobiotin synthase [Bacteroidia bacterium]